MDIAMTRLFGGFDEGFYAAYNAEHPLEQGWEDRVDLCNLYPLLVHVNLFGGGYVAQLDAALKRYV
jgi:fructosamine-3-kinase